VRVRAIPVVILEEREKGVVDGQGREEAGDGLGEGEGEGEGIGEANAWRE